MKARPLRTDEFEAWRLESMAGYVHDMVDGGVAPDEARQTAEADYERILSDGLQTPGHHFLVLEAEPGKRCGSLWYAEQERAGKQTLYLWDFAIDPAYRGRGLGKQALTLLDELADAAGVVQIELTVFGGNERARSVYEAAGYRELFRLMRKTRRGAA